MNNEILEHQTPECTRTSETALQTAMRICIASADRACDELHALVVRVQVENDEGGNA